MSIKNHIFTADALFWIAHNNNDIFHYGVANEKETLSTGQPNLEIFTNKVEWESRLLEFGVALGDDSSIPQYPE